jgi:glucose/arabinose dehydrogenase
LTLRCAAIAILGGLVALAGGACASASHEQTSFRWKLIRSGLSSPVHIASAKSQPRRLYVVEQEGVIRVLVAGKLQREPFLDIRSRVTSGGEQGLLSVAFHPSFARNRLFYVDYTDVNGNTRVVQFRANKAGTAGVPSSARQVLFVRQPYSNHNGGQLAFAPDGLLYIGMGDGGSEGDPENRSQNLSSRLGKLLKINATKRGAQPQMAAYGLRNPWRFSFDRANGDLYIGDVGQNDWEEIDYVARGDTGLKNFGWNVYEGNSRYSSNPLSSAGRLTAPVHVYSHSLGCSVTGGFVYRGRAVPAARGRYFYGDYCTGRMWSFKIAGGRATEVRLQSQRLPDLSSFGEDVRGELYAVTLSGRLYRLVR